MSESKNTRIMVLIGKSGTRKSLLATHINDNYIGVPHVQSLCTKKDEDKRNTTYVSEYEFFEAQKRNGLAETAIEYDTSGARYYVGSPAEAYESEGVCVMDPGRVRTARVKGYEPFVVYLKASDETLEERLKKRGMEEDEIKKKLDYERMEYSSAEKMSDLTVDIEEYPSVEELAAAIMPAYVKYIDKKPEDNLWDEESVIELIKKNHWKYRKVFPLIYEVSSPAIGGKGIYIECGDYKIMTSDKLGIDEYLQEISEG